MLHRPADAASVKAYAQGGDGPDVCDLCLDVGAEANIRSAWNQEVFQLILVEIEEGR